MGGKQMEGNEQQKRQKAREARREGDAPSEQGATTGASKQRQHLDNKEEHPDKIDAIREGKHKVIRENTPEPRPGSRG
jgi:hypothetical protein